MGLRVSLEKKEEKERVRIALMRATLRLAARHGFASLGLREVAREAGIAPTSFYRHFGGMEELGQALVRELVAGIRSERGAHARAAPVSQIVSVLIDAMLAIAAREPELVRFIVAERAGASAALRALLQAEQGSLARAICEVMSRGASDFGSVPLAAAEAVADLLIGFGGRALDAAASETGSGQTRLEWSLRLLLGADLARQRGNDG